MFGFNPPQLNIGANYAAAAGQNLAAGITDAGTAISSAIEKLNTQKLAASQADSTAQLANNMGLIDDSALQAIQNTPWQQKISMAPSLIQLVGQQTAANHWNMMSAGKNAAANAKTATTRYIPGGTGWVGGTSIDAGYNPGTDSSAQ